MNSHFWAHGGGFTLQIEEDKDLAILSLGIAHLPGQGIRQATELALAALAQILRRFLGPDWNPEMVGFNHPRITGLIRYTRIFGQLPLFGQERSSLVLRAADLERAIPDADPAIAAELERYLSFREGPRARDFSEQVQELIRQSLSSGRCHAPLVAQQMGLSRRTLHRRLLECGTNFEQLLQAVRLELASEYMNAGDRTLTEISELIGFAHLSAFTRWRREWMPNR
jgi:AraC-like DNA-binding protein